MVDNNHDSANDMILRLCDNFRYLMDYSYDSLIAFDKEWGFVENYVEMQKLRFHDTLQVIIKKTGDFSKINIPPLTIQPLVENAIKHGFATIDREPIIEVVAEIKSNKVRIEILDNGTGVDNVNLSRSLGNIQDRLQYYYKDANLMISNRKIYGAEIVISFTIV